MTDPTDSPPPAPRHDQSAAPAAHDRHRREAEALRANLARRKSQSRARRTARPDGTEESTPDGAEETDAGRPDSNG
jgi:hypothetical protein